MVVARESELDKRLAEAAVKWITGEDQIKCRFLYKEYFTYERQFDVWMMTNHKPIIRGDDYGIWRRLIPIPFSRTFGPGEVDEQLKYRLWEELPGVLNWCLEGLRKWNERPLKDNPPARIIEELAIYQEESDLLGEWIREKIIEDLDERVPVSVAYTNFRQWTVDRGEFPRTQTWFTRAMRRKEFDFLDSSGKRYITGVLLRSDPDLVAESFGPHSGLFSKRSDDE